MAGRQYARGRHAIAECQRSGQKMKYKDLVEDGHVAGLLVHPDWWEPKHPQEIPVEVDDPIALFRPAPEISIPLGYGLPENLDGGTTPTDPLGNDFSTTAAATVIAGATQVAIDTATTFIIGQWVFIALDGGGFFVSRITTTCDSPTFVVPFTTPFVGTATLGNQVSVGDTGFDAAAQQAFTVTLAQFGATVGRVGYTVIAGGAGSVSPSPALLIGEVGFITEFQEVVNYETPTFGIEIFIATGAAGTDSGATVNFNTFSTIEVDHAAGTEILDTRDTGSGGDMNQAGSTEGADFSDFWFPNVGDIWNTPDIGSQYAVRFIP